MGLDIFFVFGIQLLVIIFAVILLVKIPPMNSFYGYRTKMSSINDEYWKYANKIAAKTFIVISALSIFVGIALLISKYCFNIEIDLFWYFIASAALIIFTPIIFTETKLRKKHRANTNVWLHRISLLTAKNPTVPSGFFGGAVVTANEFYVVSINDINSSK